MKRVWTAIAGLLLPMLAAGRGVPEGSPSGDDHSSFEAFLPTFEAATASFINADAAPWKRLASRRDDVTLMGGWGAYKKGWSEVSARLEWAAARFKESGAKLQVEYLSSAVSGDLAYTVAIERSTVLVSGQDTPSPMALRVTHCFRKVDGDWKLVHRHADPLKAAEHAGVVDRDGRRASRGSGPRHGARRPGRV